MRRPAAKYVLFPLVMAAAACATSPPEKNEELPKKHAPDVASLDGRSFASAPRRALVPEGGTSMTYVGLVTSPDDRTFAAASLE